MTATDDQTTVAELKALVQRFVQDRRWQSYHAPKNLSMALAIEAAELMEHFQWLSVDESRQVAKQPDQLAPVAEELADVVCYALALAHELNLDLSTAIRDKMQKNEAKYPADQYGGKWKL